jgi:WD40 repeat protein
MSYLKAGRRFGDKAVDGRFRRESNTHIETAILRILIAASPSEDGTLRLWNLKTGKALRRLKKQGFGPR